MEQIDDMLMTLLSHGRKPEVNISHAKTVSLPDFQTNGLYTSEKTPKRIMW